MTSVNQQKDNIKCNVVGVGFEFQMLSPAMIRILRWLEAHPASLESAWDVPRSISLEGIADGIGVVRSALFQPMSALEEDGLIQTRQAHVIGSGRRKRKVVHITQNGREMVKERTEEVPERRPKSTQKLKGQIPELTHLHGRRNELLRIRDAMQRGEPVHLRGMPGIGKSTLA
jgi:DNA-binding MarR family transcriptional regulator